MYRSHDMLAIQRRFHTELACRKHLESQRWPNGFRCSACGHDQAGRIRTRSLYRCLKCRKQVSLTAGTIFHKTRVSLKKWFWLILMMSQNKHGISMLEAQRLLGIGSYKTIWGMAHKIRTAMAHRDRRYKLAGLIELDDAYFGKRPRTKTGGERPVFVAISTSNRGRGPAFARMEAVSEVTYDKAQDLAKTWIQIDQARIKTDGKKVYPPLTEIGFRHRGHILGSPERAGEILPWVHILIANAKRFMQGTHHREAPKHLQRFLDEFDYRFNRRWFKGQLFDRLLTACASAPSITFGELRE